MNQFLHLKVKEQPRLGGDTPTIPLLFRGPRVFSPLVLFGCGRVRLGFVVCLSIYYTLFSFRDQVSNLESLRVGVSVSRPIAVCLSIYYTHFIKQNQEEIC